MVVKLGKQIEEFVSLGAEIGLFKKKKVDQSIDLTAYQLQWFWSLLESRDCASKILLHRCTWSGHVTVVGG